MSFGKKKTGTLTTAFCLCRDLKRHTDDMKVGKKIVLFFLIVFNRALKGRG